MEKKPTVKRVTLRLDPETYRAIVASAQDRHRSIHGQVVTIIEQVLAKNGYLSGVEVQKELKL